MFDIQILIIISIVAIFFTLAYLKPKFGLMSFVFLIPLMHKELFSIYKWDYLPVRFALIGVFLGLVIPYTVKQIKLKNHLNKKYLIDLLNRYILRDRVLWLLLLLLLVKLISLLITNTLLPNFQYIVFFSISIFIYFIIKHGYIRYGKEYLLKFLNIYLVVGFISVLLAYLQLYLKLFYEIKVGAIWPVANNLPRLGSTFWDVNHFGGYLVTLIPLYFVFTFISPDMRKRVFYFIALAASSIMLFLTQSRSSWLGLLVALIFGLTIFAFKKYLKVIGLFALGALVMTGIFFSYLDFKDLSIREKIRSYMHYRLDSTDSHMMLLEGAIQVYMDNSLFGTGSGNFDSSFRKTPTSKEYFEREPNIRKSEVPPHSVWGELISENGYVGFAIYILMMGFVLGGLFRIAIQSSSTKDVSLTAAGLFISLLGILVTGIFYSYNLEFYWFIFSIAAIYTYSQLGDEFHFTKLVKYFATNKFLPYFIILLFAGFFIFIKLASVTLLEWDEAIYAKVAKNMYLSSDWLTLNWPKATDLWMEKPPLYMWLSAFLFKLIGPDEFAARFWSALFGVSGIVLTYILGKKLFSRFTGFVASFILLTTVHYLYYSRNSILDVPVTFFILLAITAFVYALDSKKRSNLFYIFTGVSVGLAVMTKAIVGLIPLAIIFLYFLIISIYNKKVTGIKPYILIVVSMLLVAMPWHVYSYYVHGYKFIKVYLLEHIFDRGLEGLGHVKPMWWYQEVLRASLRIWIFPLIGALFVLPFIENKKLNLLLIYIAAVFIFVFFSLPADKLIWYLVPIYPFTALLAARFFDRGFESLRQVLNERFNHKIYDFKLVFAFMLIILTPFYITTVRNKIFFEDLNRPVVELIKLHNQMYPIEEFPNVDLHYAKVPSTVALFYSDHKSNPVSTVEMISIINSAAPTEFNTFLISKNRFFELKGLMKTEVTIRSDLRIRASSGDYVLVRSYPRVELLQEEINSLVGEISGLNRLVANNEITKFEKDKLQDLQLQYNNLLLELNSYGY